MDKKEIEHILKEKGYTEYKWIDPKEIEVREWVRMKCQNCPIYGSAAYCPPNTPSIKRAKRFFNEYSQAIVIHIQKTLENSNKHSEWTEKINRQLIEIEDTLFLKGYHKVYTLFVGHCKLCKECTGNPETCRHPKKARPSPEAMGIDVFETVKKLNYPIKTLKTYKDRMDRYPFILIE